jgi:hypothetical protein
MRARIPLDVDLEDRLLYGLTPTRLAYIVVALLASFAIWSSPWSLLAVRAAVALLVIGTGSVVSWGRWHGRPADVWLIDIVLFAVRTRRVTWNVRGQPVSRRAEALTAAA